MTDRVHQAAEVIHAGRLTALQRRVLADLVSAVGKSAPQCEPLATVYRSALDALAPQRWEVADQPED